MTIAATPRRSPVYTGNGVATTYAFAFKVLDATTLVVTVADENDLNSQVLVNGVDYTVTLNPDQDASPGGEISYAGLPVGHRLVITSATDASQPTSITNLSAFHANVLEAALDRIVILHQQQQEQLDRSVKVVATSEQDPSTLLDTAVTNASNYATAAAASASAASGSAGAASSSAAAAAASAATIDTATLVKRDGSQAMTGALTVPMVVTDSPMSFRNKLINGDMRIDQRNLGAAVSVTTDGVRLTDRWSASNATDGVFSAQRSTDAPPGFTNSLAITVTTADASLAAGQYSHLYHSVEGLNCADLAFGSASAKTITVSFWVKSSLTGTHSGAILNAANDRSYAFTFTVNAADTWELKTTTITGDTFGTWLTNTGTGLILRINIGAGSTFLGTAGSWSASNLLGATGAVQLIGTLNATLKITGVQIEVGNIATPFERRPIGLEIVLCQRYYESGTMLSIPAVSPSAGVFFAAPISFRVTKRAAPTVTVGTPTFGIPSSGTVVFTAWYGLSAATVEACRVVVQHSGTAPAGAVVALASATWTADAEL
jgi:hypothetical protein